MIINIDWLKAPEFATHYGLIGPNKSPVWFDHEGYIYDSPNLIFDYKHMFSDNTSFDLEDILVLGVRPVSKPNDQIKRSDLLSEFNNAIDEIMEDLGLDERCRYIAERIFKKGYVKQLSM